MSWLTKMLGMSSNRNASNDFWWQTLGAGSHAGVRVTHESAMQSAIVYSCVKIISGTLASLPMKTYRRLDGGNKEEIPEHPLYELLHDQANEEHTAQEFRETMTAHALLRGTGIAEILPGNRGAIDQLIPIHPDEIKPVKVTDVSGRRRVQWEVRKNGEPTRTLLRDELLILRALVLHPDGILGIDPITAEANAIGARVASQEYAARFFQNDAQAGLIVQHPSYFKKKEDRDRFIEGWQRMSTGANRHKTRVLEFGMEAKSLTMTNEQAQFLETQKYQDNDIARIFNIPLHKVAILERATYTNIEQQAIEWVQDTLMPWAVRWTQCVKRDLIRQRSRSTISTPSCVATPSNASAHTPSDATGDGCRPTTSANSKT